MINSLLWHAWQHDIMLAFIFACARAFVHALPAFCTLHFVWYHFLDSPVEEGQGRETGKEEEGGGGTRMENRNWATSAHHAYLPPPATPAYPSVRREEKKKTSVLKADMYTDGNANMLINRY